LQGVAREIVTADPEFSIQTVARYCGVTRQTAGRWCGDITERRRLVRKVKALLLTRAGYSARDAGDLLGVEHTTVVRDVNDDILHQLTEDLLREALVDLPAECQQAAEQIREDQIFATWSGDERTLLTLLRSGETVVLSMRGVHANLIEWADAAELYVRIDRRTEWGNPFGTPADGDQATSVRKWAGHAPFHVSD
jgi:hypothetical protein